MNGLSRVTLPRFPPEQLPALLVNGSEVFGRVYILVDRGDLSVVTFAVVQPTLD